MRINRQTAFAAAMFAAFAAASGARAQEAIKLKLAHPLPASHYAYEQGIKPFTDAVTKKTNGRVTFEVYPANQLGKDYLTLVTAGLADLSMIVTSYAPDKFPLTAVTELPGLYLSSCEAVGRFAKLAQPDGVLGKSEYKGLGINALYVNTLPPYGLMMLSRKVENLADASGLKVYAPGAGLQKAIAALGGVPVRLTATDIYDAATRGTIDGVAISYSSLAAYKVDANSKYSVEGVGLGASSWIMAVTEKRWNALPADVRQAMVEASASAQQNLCDYMDRDNSAVRDRMVREQGHVVVRLSDAQIKLWNEKLAGVAAEWSAQINAAGKPGAALVDAMRGASH